MQQTQHEFSSAYGIGNDVTFRPMYRQQQAMGIADEEMDGRIVAVRFTEAKVFYDVLGTYHGIVFDNVDSAKVSAALDFSGLALQDVPALTPATA